MTNAKKTHADKPTAEWKTNDFLAYLTERHSELYGIDYRPFRSWAAERGLIGGLVGTKTKAAKVSPEFLRKFIDECFASHRVTAQYPGVSFSWFYQYKTAIWQRLEAEELAERQREEAEAKRQAAGSVDAEDLDGWF
ncbi:hypothetical protein GJU41_11735 [Bacillus idriensis]|uniref:Uncharacterized protein n=1 Tax=Metabacillus idriensis TaxID=324768 RepID=A0A6I2MFR4_9BACI|nr:hypothetical protein [Metabacillus idriensis]MRX54643.1 hypothetical protein [Metabacillus idriensis]